MVDTDKEIYRFYMVWLVLLEMMEMDVALRAAVVHSAAQVSVRWKLKDS